MSSARTDYSDFADETLVDCCRSGDSHAWRELVNRYRRLAYGIPLALGLQTADAEEVFQHTFTALLESLPRLRDASRLEAWLVTAARRAALRLKRGDRRRAGLSEAWAREAEASNPGSAPEDEIERIRRGERLRRALEGLGDPCRALLTALFSEPPRPYRQVARDLGLAVGSLGATRARCLERLRRRLLRARAAGAPARPGPGGDGS